MRSILAFIALSAWGQTTITDTLKIAPGNSTFSGEIVISAPAMVFNNYSYTQWRQTYTITSGALSIVLIPNDAATPAGTTYSVEFRPSNGAPRWTETWRVPTSASPVTYRDVKVVVQLPLNLIPYLPLSQLGFGSVLDGQVLTRSGDSWVGSFGSGGSGVWGGIIGTLANQTDLQSALSAKQATITGAPGSWPSTFAPSAHASSHQAGGSDVIVAATATALAANGANCSAGYYPLGVSATGAAEDCTAAGGASVANYPVVFSAATSVTVAGTTHNLGSANLVGTCWTNATPRERVEGWIATVHPSTYDLTITFPVAFSGTCAMNVSGGGAGGGGAGDVVGPSVSVDSEVALFNSTTGKLIKRASATGVAKLTSGVLGVVSGVGTDCVLVNGSSGACGSGGSVTAGTGISVAGSVVSVDTAAVPSFLTGSATIDFTSISAGACQIQTLTLTGAVTGDSVIGGWPADMSTGIIPRILVSAANTVQVQLCNTTGGAIDPPSRTYGATIVRSF